MTKGTDQKPLKSHSTQPQYGEMLFFRVRGEPVAKGRGRMVVRNGRPIQFTPAKTKTWEQEAATLARIEMRSKPPYEGAVSLWVDATFSIPASWPKWKREAARNGQVKHTAKPDADNLTKIVKDALTRAAVWLDDAQVWHESVSKGYGELPEVVVQVIPIAGYTTQSKRR